MEDGCSRIKHETLDEPLDDACDIARVHSAAPANPPSCRVPLPPLSGAGRVADGGSREQQTSAAGSSSKVKVWLGIVEATLSLNPSKKKEERGVPRSMEHDSLVLHLPKTASARVFGLQCDVPATILPVSLSVPVLGLLPSSSTTLLL